MKVVTKMERKLITKMELNDRAIKKLKVADFEFSYKTKNPDTGLEETRYRNRITIPIKVT